ncbi:exo-alpha-sialidase [Planctomicrobium sp. SH664]|uniref:exo-alpha-sialidase n=1 Tax=Planctomicrobium sp. SH664 TaxID=3448125 RepID=UPI003F5C1B2F
MRVIVEALLRPGAARLVPSLALVVAVLAASVSVAAPPLDYEIDLTTASEGFDGQYFWVHPRAGIIPPHEKGNSSSNPLVVMIMQRASRQGSDVFYDIYSLKTSDWGTIWSTPDKQSVFARRPYSHDLDRKLQLPSSFSKLMHEGDELTVCDMVPKWHAASKTLLATGQTVSYRNDRIFELRPRATAYATYDAAAEKWNDWKVLHLPAREEFGNYGSGAGQRVDLENGEILLPIFHRTPGKLQNFSRILRCQFDGEHLTCVEEGAPLSVPVQRGFVEPSLTRFQEKYYLTLRNDVRGYVAVGDDGMNFREPQAWTFDDGTDLGNYNTQQHWVTHRDGLYLLYTRKGANNDHVMRHRAPMFIAQVDPVKLQVIRSTERVLMPERGARLGNFAVTEVSPNETWVTESEWMQPAGCEKYGSNNSVWVARLKWNRPNE